MKVSIIVPVFNQELYLRECLDSLIKQTLDQYEIIIINDASTDSSQAIINEYHENYSDKIKFIVHDENKNLGGARNSGLDIANGEYIAFVDSDDKVDSNMFENLYANAKKYNSDIVDCDYFKWLPSKNLITKEESISINDIKLNNTENRKRILLNPGPIWSKLYKSDLFYMNNLKFTSNMAFEDNEIMPTIIALAKKITKISENYYYYRYDNLSITRTQINSFRLEDRLKSAQLMMKRFHEYNLDSIFFDEINYLFIQYFYISSIEFCLTKFKPSKFRILYKIRSELRIVLNDYRKNPYFKDRSSRGQKYITLLNDINPIFYYFFYTLLKPYFSLKNKIHIFK